LCPGPALANERVQTNAAGQVVFNLRTAWREGITHLVLSPLEFMQLLPGLIQPAPTAPVSDRLTAVSLGGRMPGLGREGTFDAFGCSHSP